MNALLQARMTDWHSSLCSVCIDCSKPVCPCCITCCACFAPCVIYGKTTALSNGVCCAPCCFYCIVSSAGLGCCLGMAHRFRVGLSYNIYHHFDCGTCCCVCLASLFCSPCSLAQAYVQINSDSASVTVNECTGIVQAPQTYNHIIAAVNPAENQKNS